MTTATKPTLTNTQAIECARHKSRIVRLFNTLDARIADYNRDLGFHPRRIAKAVAELNEAIAEAGAFRASLGDDHGPYQPVEIAVPSLITYADGSFDAIYDDLDELRRDD